MNWRAAREGALKDIFKIESKAHLHLALKGWQETHELSGHPIIKKSYTILLKK